MPAPADYLRTTWTRTTDARLQGLALAGEAGLVLAWDVAQRLYLWNRHGAEQGRAAVHFGIAAAAVSEDGSRIVVAGNEGELWWFNRDLHMVVDLKLRHQLLAVVLDSLGIVAAVSDATRRTRLLTRSANEVIVFETPRPLHHLQFLATETCLLGAADYGYLSLFEPSRLTLWHETPMSHIGSLSAAGNGATILLACYSAGILRFGRDGQRLSSLPTPAPCRVARTDFDGSRILAGCEGGSLALLNCDGAVLNMMPAADTVVAIGLGPLGDWGAVGMSNGTVMFVETG